MKTPIAAALAAALTLSGCAGTPFVIPGTTITIDPTMVAADVAGLCAYRVEVQDIAALLSTAPLLGTANAVAALICSNISSQVIVTPAAAVRRGARSNAVILNGVTLRYQRY